jgi:hypothetical protein
LKLEQPSKRVESKRVERGVAEAKWRERGQAIVDEAH